MDTTSTLTDITDTQIDIEITVGDAERQLKFEMQIYENRLQSNMVILNNSLYDPSILPSARKSYVHFFLMDYEHIFRALRSSRESFKKRQEEKLSELEEACRVLESSELDDKYSIAPIQRLKSSLQAFYSYMDNKQSLHLQFCLLKIMSFEEPGCRRDEIWKRYLAPYGSHVTQRRHLRPEPDSTDHRVLSSQLPQELMAMVYDFADLETCVVLREVGPVWYSVFHQVDLRSKLVDRNPWMRPQEDDNGDFRFWSDCVLVFVARLKKWQWVDSMEDITVPEGTVQSRRTIVASKLEPDEHLPLDFKGLNTDVAGLAHSDLVAIIDEDKWTWSKNASCAFQLIYHDDTATVLQCKDKGVDLIVTLPPEIKPDIIWPARSITITESFVMVGTLELPHRIFAVPLDRPHYDHGFWFDADYAFCRELGGGGGGSSTSTSTGVIVQPYILDDPRNRLMCRILDPDTKEMIDYAWIAPHDSGPISLYNGLFWCLKEVSNRTCLLIPTFVDFDSPGRIYYNPEKIFTDLPNSTTDGSRGMTQFLVSPRENGCQVVDLASGIVTDVNPALDFEAAKYRVVVGFVGEDPSVFQARVF